MSIKALNWALEQNINNSPAKFVLTIICNYADDEGNCRIKQNTLAEKTALTDRAIRNHISWLEQHNYLTPKNRQKKNRFICNKYKIEFEKEKIPSEKLTRKRKKKVEKESTGRNSIPTENEAENQQSSGGNDNNLGRNSIPTPFKRTNTISSSSSILSEEEKEKSVKKKNNSSSEGSTKTHTQEKEEKDTSDNQYIPPYQPKPKDNEETTTKLDESSELNILSPAVEVAVEVFGMQPSFVSQDVINLEVKNFELWRRKLMQKKAQMTDAQASNISFVQKAIGYALQNYQKEIQQQKPKKFLHDFPTTPKPKSKFTH